MPIKDTLTLEDAVRLTGPLSFNIMLKPAGSLCNLDCQYCNYLDKAEIYGRQRGHRTQRVIYPCDHFVYPDYCLGNILTDNIKDMMTSPRMTKFGLDKRNALPRKCLCCKWLFACNGECPKHRFSVTEKGETGLNALCRGLSLFYFHVAPYMDKMKELLLIRQAPAGVIPWARTMKTNR